ncbi:MAG TPA: tRNA 2-selenouridine(34) synthase MnmH [Bacillales bacterium]|nr:tRNA 2-selenouridine(34) synthase MnmH [Bacillales bacterium]
MAFQIPAVTIEALLKTDHPVVDVRTPAEFAEFHIPGAVNLPIFTNDERAQVGTTYTQISKDAAKELGLELVSDKLPGLFQNIKELHQESGQDVILHCWRGGMRSRTIAALMNSLGLPCRQLEGGIRSFRKLVMKELGAFAETAPPFVVLEGLTGTRKTDILAQLEQEGYPVVDLEGMAGHRGSAFGAIGLKQNSQKQFESLLWQRLNELKDAPYLIIEAESKRIGNVILPDFVLERKQAGSRIHMTYPFQKRVKSIYEEYEPEQHEKEFRDAVFRVEKRMGTEIRKDLMKAMEARDYFQVIAILLENYYDPRYQHSAGQYETPIIHVNMEHFQEGVHEVKLAIESIS